SGQRCVDSLCVTDTDGVDTDEQAPAIAISSPESGAVFQFGEPVPLTATVVDDQTPATSLVVTWASDRTGFLGTATVTSAGLATFEPVGLLAGEHVLTATAVDEAQNAAEASVTIEIDGRPSAPTISLSPEAPATGDDLVVTIVADGVDANRDGSELTYTYQWFVSGELREDQTGPIVSSTATVRGQTWEVRVAGNDPTGPGDEATASVTIGNAVPTCETVVMLPSAGDTKTSFTCLCSDRDDADVSDPKVDSCTFMNGDAILSTVDVEFGSCLLDPELTERGMVLTCVFTPSDGTDAGAPATSPEVYVQNVKPSTPAAALTPEAGKVETLFHCELTQASTDADGDEITYERTWLVNDFPNPGTGSEYVVADQLVSDDAETPARGGDELRCEIRAADTADAISSPALSNAVVLDNTAPAGGSVIIQPATAHEDTVLTCIGDEATDADGDTVEWTYQWTVDDVLVEGVDGDTLTGEHFDQGQEVDCIGTPSDGADGGEPVPSKTPVIILNSLPSITSVQISPDTTNRPGSFACVGQGWVDLDGDPETFAYAWLQVADPADLLLEGHTDEVLVPQDADLVPGDQVRCIATPVNGEEVGVAVTSDNLGTVVNTPPILGGAKLGPPDADVGAELVCEAVDSEDPDGDEVSLSVVWKLNGVVIEGETGATLSGVFEKGQEITCELTPQDGYEDGEPQLSNPVTIANTLPQVKSVTLDPLYGAVCDDFVCTANEVTDADPSDNVVLIYAWMLNDVPLEETGATLSGAALVPGDVLQCFATPWDGAETDDADPAPVLGESVGSNLAEIINNPPWVDGVEILETEPVVGDTLTCAPFGFDDAQCDPEPAYTYKWYVAGATLIEGADGATLDTSGMSPGDVVSCLVVPWDGWIEGASALAAGVTLGSSTPCWDPAETGACDDDDPCTQDDQCQDGACAGTPVVCADDDACNGVETCDGSTGDCIAGTPVVCADDDVCYGVETCDGSTGDCIAGT
ncbi:MAG: hypothetical protein QF464_06490, partial [Myxococcota bacterium]|nr:hypothetical protein [Myxococcota bacterium]